MTEIKYELTNVSDTYRTMRAKGTHYGLSGFEEVWLGEHSGIDVWAGIETGVHSRSYGDSAIYLDKNYTHKQLATYNYYLSPYDISLRRGDGFINQHWSLADVHLHFHLYGVQIYEKVLLATYQEFGFCPEANLLDVGEPQMFGVLDVVKRAVKENEDKFDYHLHRATIDAKSMVAEMTKKLL